MRARVSRARVFAHWIAYPALALLALGVLGQQLRRQPEAGEYIKILEDPHRISRLNPTEIIKTLELKPGDTVADIGSGSGLFTRPMARAVLPGGKVYAVDIDSELLAHVAKTASEQGITNIVTVLAPEDSPALPSGSIDLGFICDTLHHIEKRELYLERLKTCLKPAGRLAIIDFSTGWPAGHESMRYSLEDLEAWTKAAGYVKIAEYNTIEGNFFRIYRAAGQ